MKREEVELIIRKVFVEVFENHVEGKEMPQLTDTSVLLETGLDSLGFAILVTSLEEEMDFDPFTESDEPYYPVTFADFVNFYHRNFPK
jgi:acyl carrier protein